MNLKYLKYELAEGIATVTVNRPEVLNALSNDVLDELAEVFREIQRDDNVKCAIVTGEGRAFVAGADISEMKGLSVAQSRELGIKGSGTMQLIEDTRKPVIAAVNGFALGGGCELAMCCDIRIASEKAKFGQPEVNLGIMPFFGGTQRMSRLVGKGMAKYLIFTAEYIDAAEALRIGLVERVVAPEALMETAVATAKTIMSKAPTSIRMAKRAIDIGCELDIRSGCAVETESYISTAASADRTEGMAAFLEKRPAQFKGE